MNTLPPRLLCVALVIALLSTIISLTASAVDRPPAAVDAAAPHSN